MGYLFYDVIYGDKIYTLDFTKSNLYLGKEHCICQGCFGNEGKLYIRLALDHGTSVNCEIVKQYNFTEDTLETKMAYWDEHFRFQGYDEIGPTLENWIQEDNALFEKFLKEETDYYKVLHAGLSNSQKELLDLLTKSLETKELNTPKTLGMLSRALFGNDSDSSIAVIKNYLNAVK